MDGIQPLLDFAEEARTSPDAFPDELCKSLEFAVEQAKQLQGTLDCLGMQLSIFSTPSDDNAQDQMAQIETWLLNPDLSDEERAELEAVKKALSADWS